MFKKYHRSIIMIVLVATFMAFLYFVVGKPMIAFLGEPQKLQDYVDQKGLLGVLVFGAFIFVQSISTCIPGLPFYLAAGYVWGGVKGALICDLFATLANTVAFLIGKKFGRNFLLQIFPEDKLEYVEGFIKKGNPKFIHAMFMFLPLPKDTYAWLGYYSEENVIEWIVITFLARFAHIFLYTLSGEKLVTNNYGLLILGGVIAVVVYLVMTIHVKRTKENDGK